ncbi:hypothetical protein IM792_15965 [Mucilaginibacter sp. JRF]|uniref:glycine-rich domain-containing protein n=1 Tax=Mucilaginibacter sp. JRF TaxID=2780088 RepID=UPI00187DF585|nr:hypothetical protein [Mucilaginibacter sp. JRF]MBE9585950.1 hypothetical protein [Mucilaginibacter sp. JRF]
MNAAGTALWDNIRQFQFDDAGVSFKFSDRLARENGWSVQYTHRVITEYRKFIFLCCVSTDGVTPSDPVDQAWHLHLTYTRSYWIDLCQNTLDKQIHHNPTKGGSNEANKFKKYYQSSNYLYKQYFGTEPPADIWHTSKQRFTEINYQRVNLSRYWLIRKPRASMQSIVATLSMISVVIFVQASELTIIPVILLLVVLCAFATYFNRSRR